MASLDGPKSRFYILVDDKMLLLLNVKNKPGCESMDHCTIAGNKYLSKFDWHV